MRQGKSQEKQWWRRAFISETQSECHCVGEGCHASVAVVLVEESSVDASLGRLVEVTVEADKVAVWVLAS